MAEVYDERQGAEITAYFEGQGIPVLPTSVHHRLYCLTTNQEVIGFTEDTVNVAVDDSGITRYYTSILIPGSANTIRKSSNARELKELMVIADKDTDREYSQRFQYYVLNTKRS